MAEICSHDSRYFLLALIPWGPTGKGQGNCSLNWEKNEVVLEDTILLHLSFGDGWLERQGSESGDVGSSPIPATTLTESILISEL